MAENANAPGQTHDGKDPDTSRRNEDDGQRRDIGAEMGQKGDALIGTSASPKDESVVFDLVGAATAFLVSSTGMLALPRPSAAANSLGTSPGSLRRSKGTTRVALGPSFTLRRLDRPTLQSFARPGVTTGPVGVLYGRGCLRSRSCWRYRGRRWGRGRRGP